MNKSELVRQFKDLHNEVQTANSDKILRELNEQARLVFQGVLLSDLLEENAIPNSCDPGTELWLLIDANISDVRAGLAGALGYWTKRQGCIPIGLGLAGLPFAFVLLLNSGIFFVDAADAIYKGRSIEEISILETAFNTAVPLVAIYICCLLWMVYKDRRAWDRNLKKYRVIVEILEPQLLEDEVDLSVT